MRVVEEVLAWGHPNVRATHPTTIEVTKDPILTPRGNCIIAVSASKSLVDFSPAFKRAARKLGSIIKVVIDAGGVREEVTGFGDPSLTFEDAHSFVIRKSSFACGRTLMIRADKAARELSRELVKRLRDPAQRVLITVTVTA